MILQNQQRVKRYKLSILSIHGAWNTRAPSLHDTWTLLMQSVAKHSPSIQLHTCTVLTLALTMNSLSLVPVDLSVCGYGATDLKVR